MRRDQQRKVVELIERIRGELDILYQSDMPEEAMRRAKRQQLELARERYRALRRKWRNDPGYDAWFAGELNNARLGSVSAYNTYVETFLALLASEGHDFEAFYRRVAEIGALDAAERRERMLAVPIE
jgi:predicted aminopeptidase